MVKDKFENLRLKGKYLNEAAKREVQKCVFCDLREKYIISKNNLATLTVNIFPYIDGQMLVIPNRHIESYFDLTDKELNQSNVLIKLGVNLLKKELGIENLWLIFREGSVSGKTIKHIHWNIIPYVDELNTWHYQEIKIAPIDLASRLRKLNKNDRT